MKRTQPEMLAGPRKDRIGLVFCFRFVGREGSTLELSGGWLPERTGTLFRNIMQEQEGVQRLSDEDYL